MSLGVYSEVGKLRKVMVHRPGLEHAGLHRRTLRNCSSMMSYGSARRKPSTARSAR
jgi:arginine deiminase